MNMNLIHVVSDIYNNNITEQTVEMCREFEQNDPDVWYNVPAIRYLASIPDTRTDYENVAMEVKWELEDDLGMHE